MEDHPILFLFLIVVYMIKAMYYTVLITVTVLIALYKWINKKIKGRQENTNVAN